MQGEVGSARGAQPEMFTTALLAAGAAAVTGLGKKSLRQKEFAFTKGAKGGNTTGVRTFL
jgi:hypothetical protein